MKVCQVIAYAGGAALIGLGAAMAVTNPGRTAYEEFATEQLSAYVQENVCTKGEKSLGKLLQGQCTKLVESVQPQMHTIIAENTDRMNFGIFSIYKTELSVAVFLPSYEFETVAVWDNFYIYKAEEK